MKRLIKFLASFLLLCILFQSCYTNKPMATRTSSPDYNKRIDVAGARYHKKGNTFDVVFNVGMVGAGAFGGYNSNLIQQQTENGREPVKVANAAIGALAGASVAYLIDQIAGKNKTFPVTNPNDWIKKANDNYKFLRGSNDNFTIIHTAVENDYTIKNISDVRDFKAAFPGSTQTDRVFQQAANTLSRNSLPDLIELFPNNRYADEAKMKYVLNSPSYEEMVAAVKKYPVSNAADLCLDKIKNINHAIDFANNFNTFTNKKLAVINAFQNGTNSISDINRLKDTYKEDFFLTAADLKNDNISKNYYHAQYLLNVPKTIKELDAFHTAFQWLQYTGKKKDVAGIYWDITDKTYSKGMDVIWEFLFMEFEPVYADLNLTGNDLKAVMSEKLQKEVANVSVQSVKAVSQQNPEWEKWKDNTTYSAGLVQDKGELVYYIYGEVKNNSKYDLPVSLTGNATLVKRSQAQGTGPWTNLLAETISEKVETIGRTSNNYVFPLLPTNSSSVYVIQLNFGYGERRSGTNIADLIKWISETLITDVSVKPSFISTVPGKDQLTQQDYWQHVIINGMPDAKLTDTWRNEEMRQEVWDKKYVNKQAIEAERARRRAIEREEERRMERLGRAFEQGRRDAWR